MSLPAVNLGYLTTMFTMTLKEIQDATKAKLIGSVSNTGSDLVVHGVNTDSRTIKEGELFVALKGENYDAHNFIEHAKDRGAAAYLLEHEVEQVKPALIVDDTRVSFGQLAKAWRNKYDYPVVAVTGSNGKTTVKEMLFSILSTQGNVLATKGNFNNDIGVPITLFRMTSAHDSAVIEMGANHSAEISNLTNLVSPDVAIITNAAAAHLEGFGSIDGVARAKGEIFEGLSESGTAIINYDDSHYAYWKQLVGNKKIISFGSDCNADVSFDVSENNNLSIKVKGCEDFDLKLPLLGRHNLMNALAAIAAAVALNVDLKNIKQGLESIQAVPGRLVQNQGVNNSIVIDDTYNANPASLTAAIESMQCFSGTYHVVLGDMGELGKNSIDIHKNVAKSVKEGNVKYLYTIGEYSHYTSDEFGENAEHFSSQQELVNQLVKNINQNDVVLVKGSRSMHMERVVEALCAVTSKNEQEPEVR